MYIDINAKYNIKKLDNSRYLLSIKGNIGWVSGTILFIVFVIFLSAAFFLPMGYSIKKYLKLIVPLTLIFIFIAFIAGLVFKKRSEKIIIFDASNHTIYQQKQTQAENWKVLQLPEKAIILRDSYKFITKDIGISNYLDNVNLGFVMRYRLMVIPLNDSNSKKEILQKIIEYEKSIIGKAYASGKIPQLPENAILISDDMISDFQDLIIEGLIKIFDWELIDMITSKPEIYNRLTLDNVNLDSVIENIEKPEKAPMIREKIKNDKIIFTINGVPFYLKIVILIFMGALSAFYAFFAILKNDTPFWVGFTPMFMIWVILLSFKTKFYVTKKSIYKRLSLFGIPLTPKNLISTTDIGDIKIKSENKYTLVFFKRGSRKTLFSLTLPKLDSGKYILHRIVEFLNQ